MRRYTPTDLDEYTGCPEDGDLGYTPLAIGFLHRKNPFATGKADKNLLPMLKPYCLEPLTVCKIGLAQKCPICNERIKLDDEILGQAEIRVLGTDDIYAAPNLIYHYIETHAYIPPPEFIDAVLKGSDAGSIEHRALINTLR